MARVDDSEVRVIRPSDSITDYTPFIVSASLLVDDLNTKCGKSYDATRLKEIERWLSAHFAAAQDPLVARERFEQSEKTYQIGNRQLYGITSDIYGQKANMLAEGCLTEFDKKRYSVKSLGATYEDSPID
jgi:hypothetical protein